MELLHKILCLFGYHQWRYGYTAKFRKVIRKCEVCGRTEYWYCHGIKRGWRKI